jgi:aminobenzoyl-glutamate utilization protein B
MGRSALDAVELMNIGWNYRREHLRLQHRSHYVIVHGGDQPNVVPPEATVWYFFRELDFQRIKDLHALGTKIARAAAEMTDTTMTERILAATWPAHHNKAVAEALYSIQNGGCQPVDDDQRCVAMQKEIGNRLKV